MNGSRHDAAPPGGLAPSGSVPGDEAGQWPASAAPHGYDRNEFSPGESRRDFPPPPRADGAQRAPAKADAPVAAADRRDTDENKSVDAVDADVQSPRPAGGDAAGTVRPAPVFRD